MFKDLLTAQSNILGSDSGGKSYRDIVIANKLEEIIPEIYQIQDKVTKGTATEDDLVRLEILKTQKNNFTKSNPITEGAIDIFVKSPQGATLFNSIVQNLLLEDNKNQGAKYKGNKNDTQLYIDAIEEIKKILGQFSGGGRGGLRYW